MTEIMESYIDDDECLIRIVYWEPYRPAFTNGPPEDCSPAEGGYGDWEVLDLNGERSPELESRLTDDDRKRIDKEVREFMEQSFDDY